MLKRDENGKFTKFEDIKEGTVFGDFKIIEFSHKDKSYNKHYKVQCLKCGNITTKCGSKLKNNPQYHSNKHCGVWLKEYDENIGLTINDYTITEFICSTKFGYRYKAKCNICGIEFDTLISNFKKGYGTTHKECTNHIPKDKYINRFRKIYSCMRYRTTNEAYNEYHLYGGRGISSDYFEDFMVFYKEMYESYKKHVDEFGEKDTSLDRIDVDGNYETSNCRWATNKEQGRNKRSSNMITIKGITKSLSEWCEDLGLKYSTVSQRIHAYNWSVKEALELKD